MTAYRHRAIEPKLKQYLKQFSVVGLTGPRQSGKSTLLLHLLKDYTYITFDDHRYVNAFYNDPQKFMRIYADKIIFDEVQKVPELFDAIKLAVDQNRNQAGKFVLTGSSQFSLMKNISESLAGRIGLLSLLPYEIGEMPENLYEQSLYRGSYPELVSKKYNHFEDWFAAYFDTYLSKDVSALANIGDKRDFRRLVYLLAANTSQLLNISRFATDLGVDVKTVKRWISILEASYIIFLLPPYYRNFGKRIVKSPKVYFYDTGLASFLTGITSEILFEQGPLTGPLFENYVVSEILKRETHRKTHAELFYYRTQHGVEIDVIVDRKTTCDFIEIKSTETFKPRMVDAIEKLKSPKDKAYLLYRGEKFSYGTDIKIINYKDYLL